MSAIQILTFVHNNELSSGNSTNRKKQYKETKTKRKSVSSIHVIVESRAHTHTKTSYLLNEVAGLKFSHSFTYTQISERIIITIKQLENSPFFFDKFSQILKAALWLFFSLSTK